jgi:hypothetical protein
MRPTKILNFNFRDIVIHVYHIYDLLKIDDGKFVASVSSTKRFCDLLKWWGIGKMLVDCSGDFLLVVHGYRGNAAGYICACIFYAVLFVCCLGFVGGGGASRFRIYPFE